MVESLSEVLPHWAAVVLAAAIAAGVLVAFIGGAASSSSGRSGRCPAASRTGSARPAPGRSACSSRSPTAIKLITKEDTAPDGADRFLFRIAPYLAFCAAFAGFIALPFGYRTRRL